MMSGVPLETCWAFNKLWNNKFHYKAASCWYFYWVIYDARIHEYQICGIVLHVLSACGVWFRRLVDDGTVLLLNQLAAVSLSCSPVLFYACGRNKVFGVCTKMGSEEWLRRHRFRMRESEVHCSRSRWRRADVLCHKMFCLASWRNIRS